MNGGRSCWQRTAGYSGLISLRPEGTTLSVARLYCRVCAIAVWPRASKTLLLLGPGGRTSTLILEYLSGTGPGHRATSYSTEHRYLVRLTQSLCFGRR